MRGAWGRGLARAPPLGLCPRHALGAGGCRQQEPLEAATGEEGTGGASQSLTRSRRRYRPLGGSRDARSKDTLSVSVWLPERMIFVVRTLSLSVTA